MEGSGPWRWLLPNPGASGDGILGDPARRTVDTLINTSVLMGAVIATTYFFAWLYMLQARRFMVAFLVAAHLFWFGLFTFYLLAIADRHWKWHLDWITAMLVSWWVSGGLTFVLFFEYPLELPRRKVSYRLRPPRLADDWVLRANGVAQSALSLRRYTLQLASMYGLR